MINFNHNMSRELESIGVHILTGEACGIGMRWLCDLTEDGCTLWKEFTRTTPTSEPWNSGGKHSVMATPATLEDMWIFAMVKKGLTVIKGYYGKSCCVQVYDPNCEEDKVSAANIMNDINFNLKRTYKKGSQPGTGLDNTHAMSGRTI